MKKAIISLLMTLLFLVNTSRGVAMSKNNQLKKAERADDQNVVDSLNKSAAAVVLEPTLTSLPPQLNTSTTMPENTTIVGHQIRSKLEQIQQHQAKFFEEIKTSMESLVCRLGISSFCIKQIESPNDSNSTTTDLNGNGNAQGPSSSTPQLLPPGLTQGVPTPQAPGGPSTSSVLGNGSELPQGSVLPSAADSPSSTTPPQA